MELYSPKIKTHRNEGTKALLNTTILMFSLMRTTYRHYYPSSLSTTKSRNYEHTCSFTLHSYHSSFIIFSVANTKALTHKRAPIVQRGCFSLVARTQPHINLHAELLYVQRGNSINKFPVDSR